MTTSLDPRRLAALGLALALTACTGSSFKSAAQTSQKPTGSGGERPTDSGEGLPGYLTDPNRVRIDRDSGEGRLDIQAPAGAVANDQGRPERTKVYVWQIPLDEYRRLVDAVDHTLLVKGTLRGVIPVGTDGGFGATIAYPSDDPVLLVCENSASNTTVTVRSGEAGRISAATKDFASSAPIKAVAKPNLLWSKEEFEKATKALFERTNTEDPLSSAQENRSYAYCMMKQIATRWPFADYGADNDKYFTILAGEPTKADCVEESLAVKSDSPLARQLQGLWNKRQIKWYAGYCAEGVQEGENPADVAAACQCQYEAIAAQHDFVSFYRASEDEAQQIVDQPDALRCWEDRGLIAPPSGYSPGFDDPFAD